MTAIQLASATRSRTWAELLLGAVAFSWAAGFVLMKSAVAHNPVWVVLWIRFLLAALLLAPMCAGRAGWTWRLFGTGSILGMLLFGSFALLISGLQRTTATNTGLLTGLCVVWIPVVGWIAFGQKLRINIVAGVTLCVAGVIVMSEASPASLGFGDLLVVCGSLVTALHILAVDRWSAAHDTEKLTLLQLGTVAIASWAVSLATGSVWPAVVDTNLVVCIGTTAFASTALAFWIQTKFQRRTTPTRAAMIFNLEPVFSALLAFAILGEHLGLNVVMACGLIVAGMCVTELRLGGKAT